MDSACVGVPLLKWMWQRGADVTWLVRASLVQGYQRAFHPVVVAWLEVQANQQQQQGGVQRE